MKTEKELYTHPCFEIVKLDLGRFVVATSRGDGGDLDDDEFEEEEEE